MTMQLIERVELTSSQASITFSNIPQDGTDLLLLISARNSNSSNDNEFVTAQFNSTTTNYSWRRLYGTGSSVASSSSTPAYLVAGRAPNNGRTSNTFGNSSFYIPNYANGSAKSASTDSVEEANQTDAYQDIYAGLWNNTAAITSITLEISDGAYNFVSGSSATLYKITKGSDGVTTAS